MSSQPLDAASESDARAAGFSPADYDGPVPLGRSRAKLAWKIWGSNGSLRCYFRSADGIGFMATVWSEDGWAFGRGGQALTEIANGTEMDLEARHGPKGVYVAFGQPVDA